MKPCHSWLRLTVFCLVLAESTAGGPTPLALQDRLCGRWGPCGGPAAGAGCSFDDWLRAEAAKANGTLEDRPSCLLESFRCVVLEQQALAEACRPGVLRTLLAATIELVQSCDAVACLVEVEYLYSALAVLWPRTGMPERWERQWSIYGLRRQLDALFVREAAQEDLRRYCFLWLRQAAATKLAVPWIGEAKIKQRIEHDWLPRWISGVGCEGEQQQLVKRRCSEAVRENVVCAMASMSQLAQDLWVLSRLGHVENGIFLEIGANHPTTMSNTYILEQAAGWQGVCVEPFPRGDWSQRSARLVIAAVGKADGLMQTFVLPGSMWGGFMESMYASNLQRLDRQVPKEKMEVAKVDTRSAASILAETLPHNDSSEPKVIHFLSLDTEGSELEILQHFPFERYRPLAIAVEHLYWEPKRTDTQKFLEEHGYILDHSVGHDDLFILEGYERLI